MNPHVRRGNDRDACADGELAPPPRTSSGRAAASRGARTSIAALACATVAPSRSRAFTKKGAMIAGPAGIPGMAFS
jgi:hypothetical protein